MPAEAATLAAQAYIRTTPCGDGAIVWHVWQAAGHPEPAAPPLVLLHGGSGSWTHWVRNIDTLRSWGRTVWVPDLPGFGDSAVPPGGADADALVAPLAQGMRALWGDARCDLVGFSFGGSRPGCCSRPSRRWPASWCWWARPPWAWFLSARSRSRAGATWRPRRRRRPRTATTWPS
ncbi:alpha/beta fold hydrolase [Paracidovorax citrulli]|uniref:alpha/beta fold hydrolase n=1 Tax=Paracidovorax citrulli TaxID=80869 RepID=UPI001E656322|nr:alpha/beta fold hydrolase [Paracidovorax citrulli]